MSTVSGLNSQNSSFSEKSLFLLPCGAHGLLNMCTVTQNTALTPTIPTWSRGLPCPLIGKG